METENLQQKKKGRLLTVSQMVTIHTKIQQNFLTSSLESGLCDYSDAYILVTGNITATVGDANTKVPFKNCAPFTKCITEINETFIDGVEHINGTMSMYNLIEYSDNYSDSS